MSSHSPVAHAPIAVNHTPNGNLNGEPFEFDDVTPGDVLNAPLEEVDPAIAAVLAGELARQQQTLEMIASENFAPRAVLQCQGSVLTNKYAEGYPGKRYYGGCEHVDISEQLAIDRALSAVRGRARQRATAFGSAGQRRRLPRAARAGRHHHGARARARRSPHPRDEAQRLRPPLQRRRLRRRPRHAPHRHGRARALGARAPATR